MYKNKYVILKNPILCNIFNSLGKGRMGKCIEKISSNLSVHLWGKEMEDFVFKILYYFLIEIIIVITKKIISNLSDYRECLFFQCEKEY